MAGQAAAGRMSEPVLVAGGLDFRLAGPGDEADLRRLLAETPLGGRWRIALTRDPDAFAADFGLAERHDVVIAREVTTGRAIGLAERLVREAFVDGRVAMLPYLGALRVAPQQRGRIAVLRNGFRALRMWAERPGDLPFALTAITADNDAARRVLGAGLRDMPIYRDIGDLSTFALRPRRSAPAAAVEPARADDVAALAAFLTTTLARHPFAPHWNEATLRRLFATDLAPGQVLLARRAGAIVGTLAVWDQRARRQTVIAAYPPPLGRLRPAINLAAPLFGLPRLPPVGATLAQATLSHLALADDADEETFLALVAAGLDQARARGFEVAVIGFASARPWRAALLRRWRAIEYRTTLFLVHWPEAAGAVAALGQGLPHPEVGLL